MLSMEIAVIQKQAQQPIALTQKAEFRVSQSHLCKQKVQFSELSFVV